MVHWVKKSSESPKSYYKFEVVTAILRSYNVKSKIEKIILYKLKQMLSFSDNVHSI